MNTRQFVFISLTILCSLKLYAQDILDHTHTKQYATYLYNIGDYSLAAEEFQRLLFQTQSDSARYFLSLSYKNTGHYQKALQYIFPLINIHDWNFIATEQYLKILTLTEQTDSVITYMKYHNLTEGKLTYIYAANMLLLYQWEETLRIINPGVENHKINYIENKLFNIAMEGMNIRKRSPLLAATFSTIIPGTGKMYVNRFQDGIYSLLITGISAWQAYSGFNKKGIYSAKGWIFASIGGGFYISNIYGSFIAAKFYNKKNRNEIIKKTKILLDDNF